MSRQEVARERLTTWVRDYGHKSQPVFIDDIKAILEPAWRRRPTGPGLYVCYPGLSGSKEMTVAIYLDEEGIANGAPFAAEWCYGPIERPGAVEGGT